MDTSDPSIAASSPRDATPSRARTLLYVLLLAMLYLWVFPYQAHVNNPNENVRVYMTVAMVDDGTFAINRIERDWGYVNDKAVKQASVEELLRRRIPHPFIRAVTSPEVMDRIRTNRLLPADRVPSVPLLYSSKAPGTSYLGVPAYWLLTRITGRNSLPPGPPPGSPPPAPGQPPVVYKPPLEKTTIIWVLRVWSGVLPALLFAWHWLRFLGRRTQSPTLRDAVFFSTMLGSLLYAYSMVFASHASNALCAMGALMALAEARDADRTLGEQSPLALGKFFIAGLLGVSVTLFEYPSGLVTGAIGLLVASTVAERNGALAFPALGCLAMAGAQLKLGHKFPAVFLGISSLVLYGLTLRQRSVFRLVAAGLGAVPPAVLAMIFHRQAFGSPFRPGYCCLENPTFNAETSQGFFGATAFSWESGARLWFDPSFGMISGTPIFVFALLGFAVLLLPEVPPRFAPYRNAFSLPFLAFMLFATVKLIKAVPMIRASNWVGPAAGEASWAALAMLACGALLALWFPRPLRADPAVAAAMFLGCHLLSRIIGMMNNWRGGWTVGPRYLATLAPFLALAALAGLDAVSQGSEARKRFATIVAAGCALASFVVSGLPSILFPHVPTEFVSPVFELFLPLLRGGYVPRNAGTYFFHSEGLRALTPFFAALAIVVLLLVRGDERKPLRMLSHAFASFAVAFLLLIPFALAARYESMPTVRWAMNMWEPQPTRPRPPSVQAPTNETPEAARNRGRSLAEAGDGINAIEAFRRAASRHSGFGNH